MDFGQFTGMPDQGIDDDEVTDIAEANNIIKQKNRSIRSLHFCLKEQERNWKVYLALASAMAMLAGAALHSWMDEHGYGACAPYDCPTRE